MGYLQDRERSRALHRRLSPVYDRLNPLFQGTHATRERYLEPLDVAEGDRVLDLGCGTGTVTAQLRERVDALAAVDLSAGQIGHAARKPALGGVAFAVADAAALPYADGAFDAVVAVGLLPYVPDPGAAVAEARRVTREGGQGLFVVPKRPDGRVRRWLFERAGGVFEPGEMADLLAGTGWTAAGTRVVHMDWLARDAVVATGRA